ncbi:NnrU family protein [Terasakiella sp. A23]|uniref:NnrU family protein n=1 Tax=Terasakiella sp. FCG-A23 TaxID=3080561 RepID=UPI002953268D|nr:NnrU family protein [Terasakiella sp. A23]MDV7341362.1 NnrU family protein [Terasakiella sp. A23]
MELLIIGLVVWVVAHLIPVAAPNLRAALAGKLGEMPYKGLFALTILGSVGLMVMGWRSIESVTLLYDIYSYVAFPGLIAVLIGFVLIAASILPSNFRRLVRHPQLVGFSLWATAHLLMNGDLRAVTLFGGLLGWALVTILLLNKRDGEFTPPAKVLPHKGVMVAALGFTLFIVAVLGHEYLSGVNLSSRG